MSDHTVSNSPNLCQKEPACIIIGAGEYDSTFRFEKKEGDFLIAADGGLDTIAKLSLIPDLIIGDFDSLGTVPLGTNVKKLPVEKDDTDTGAAVKEGEAKGFSRFLFLGCTGGRPDHTFAMYQILASLTGKGKNGYLIGDGFTVTAIKNGTLSFPKEAVGTVSVFAIGNKCKGVSIKGLHYPLSDATLEPTFPLGVSNSFTGVPAEISVTDGTLLVFAEGDVLLRATIK